MRSRLSIRGSVRPSVCPLACERNRRERRFQPARRIVWPARAWFFCRKWMVYNISDTYWLFKNILIYSCIRCQRKPSHASALRKNFTEDVSKLNVKWFSYSLSRENERRDDKRRLHGMTTSSLVSPSYRIKCIKCHLQLWPSASISNWLEYEKRSDSHR